MNKKGLILSLVLTALLAAAAWWMSRPSGIAAPSGPISVFSGTDVAGVENVQLISGPTSVQTVRMGPLPNLWMIRREATAIGESPSEWVADAGVVRAAIRVLNEAKGERIQSGAGQAWGVGFPRVRLDLPDRQFQLEFGSELAGRVPVRVGMGEAGDDSSFMVPASLAAMFNAESVKAWRSKRLLPVEATTARVRIEASGRACQLSRAGGSWGVVEPALGRGDDPAIGELLTRIAGLEIVRFADDAADQAEAALTDQSPRIVVEADRRAVMGDQVQRQTIVQEFRIGGRADVSGQNVFVRMSGKVVDADSGGEIASWGPVLGIADAAGLSSIATSSMSYVNRRALNAPAADVRRLEFIVPEDPASTAAPQTVMTVIERTPDSWAWSSGGDPVGPVPSDDLKALDMFLKLVCDERAAEVAPGGEVGEVGQARDAAWVRLGMGPGQPQSLLRVAVLEDEAPEAAWLIVTDGGLERRYPLRSWTGVANWLRARVSVPR